MSFGEKLRKLRKGHSITQAELARQAGLGIRTINNYENGVTYPKNRNIYEKLAEILGAEASYFYNENDDFVAQAQEEFGYRGRKGAEKLIREVTGLFAGGDMAEEDMDEMMLAIQEAYIVAKRNNKKYTPKKYQKEAAGN